MIKELETKIIEGWKEDLERIKQSEIEKEIIRITGGLCHYSYYDKIMPILEKANKERGLKVKMICGPVLCVENYSKPKHIISQYLEKEWFELFSSNCRKAMHSRTFEKLGFVVKEAHHTSLAELHYICSFYSSWDCKKLIQDFEIYIKSMDLKQIRDTNQFNGEFILLSEKEINPIKGLDSLDINEIRRYSSK